MKKLTDMHIDVEDSCCLTHTQQGLVAAGTVSSLSAALARWNACNLRA